MADRESAGADAGDRIMNYGKEHVAVYRTFGTPLEGVRTIPESAFDGRDDTPFGAEVSVRVEGEAFLPSFGEGDDGMLVTTDVMKNSVLHHPEDYDGVTVEGFLQFAGERVLETHPQTEAVRLSVDELPGDERPVPGDDEDGVEPSDPVFGVSHGESGYGERRLVGDGAGNGPVIEDHRSGVAGIELIRLKDDSLAGHVRDEYTTLPEHENRTPSVPMDVSWTYAEPTAALGEEPREYVPVERVRDVARGCIHENDANSIQLLYLTGPCVLGRVPQLETGSSEADDRTWITERDDQEGGGKALREPPRPAGDQQFSTTRSDLETEGSGWAPA